MGDEGDDDETYDEIDDKDVIIKETYSNTFQYLELVSAKDDKYTE